MSASETPRTDVEGTRQPRRCRKREVVLREISSFCGDLKSSIHKRWNGLGQYKKATLAAFSSVLVVVSFFLNVLGKGLWCSLAAFLLAAIGCGVVVSTCIVQRNTIATTEPKVEKQLLVVDAVFSAVDLIVSILALVGVQTNKYTAPILLLLFGAIAFVFNLKKDGDISDSSHTIMQASSSPSVIVKSKPDVFLSFRGEYTSNNFTGNLFATLRRANIATFIDEDGLKTGDEISPVCLKSIEDSKVSIIIFSEDYASSTRCLDGLQKLLECMKSKGQFVLPIFYEISPSDVRKQTGSYRKAFVEHHERFPVRVEMWRDALYEAANISGFYVSENRSESEVVEQILGVVMKKLNDKHIAST